MKSLECDHVILGFRAKREAVDHCTIQVEYAITILAATNYQFVRGGLGILCQWIGLREDLQETIDST